MKKNYNPLFNEKLLKYSAFASGALVLGTKVSAQINYTDINPDIVLVEGQSYNIDFNGADNDFRLEAAGTGTTYNRVMINALQTSGNSWIGGGSYNHADVLNLNEPVNTAAGWTNGGSYNTGKLADYNFGYSKCPWIGVDEKYLGVRFKIGTETHYGWIRCSVSDKADTLVIHDYAYEETPDQQILAGDTGTATLIKEDVQENVNIYGFDGNIYIQAGEMIEGAVNITNTLGQTVYTTTINDRNKIIALNELKDSILFIRIRMENGVITRKILL